jgi:hypothetical protein
VAQNYNPGRKDQEDYCLRPAWANSLPGPISKIAKAKQTGGVAQAVQHLLCKCKALSSNPSTNKKQLKKKRYSLVRRVRVEGTWQCYLAYRARVALAWKFIFCS